MKPKFRDARLDFWRGLCLIDMLLVHLLVQGLEIGHYPHAIIGEYLRFAAGGFIFVAGMGVGRIFLPKALKEATRLDTYQALWRRAFYILCVHYTATLGFMIFSPLRGETLPPIYVLLRDILLFREGYDLLPFYVVMIALSPMLIEAVRRGYGLLLAIVSAALFVWGQGHFTFALEWIPIQRSFFVILWQAIFVAGLLFGANFKAYDTLVRSSKTAIAVAVTVALFVLSTLAYGWHFGLPKPTWIDFIKVPLSVGEAMRYVSFMLAVIFVTDVLWRSISGGRVERFVCRLGRRSLAMYVAHVFVVGALVPLSYKDGLPLWAHLTYMPVAVAILWTIAFVMDKWAARTTVKTAETTTPWWLPRLGAPALSLTAVVVATVLGVWAHYRPMPVAEESSIETATTLEWTEEPQILGKSGLKFLLPVTPGILHVHDEPSDVEVAANAGFIRTGRTTGNGLGGGSVRRQL